jgi:hypothetical protein
MYPNEVLLELHAATMSLKEHLLVNHGEYDMSPILSLGWFDDPRRYQISVGAAMEAIVAMLTPDDGEQPFDVGVAGTLHSILSVLTREHDTPMIMRSDTDRPVVIPTGKPLESVWFACEQFLHPPEETLEEALKRVGTLQHDFETNPASTVLEMVTTYVIETGVDGLAEWARISTPHKRIEGGLLEWIGTELRRSDESPFLKDESDSVIAIVTPFVTRESLA